jgi:glycosyltransferase 2 family protein
MPDAAGRPPAASASSLSAGRLLRYLIAIGLTAWVLWQADPRAVLRAAAGADFRWILLSIALVIVDRALMAMRWIDLLGALTPGSRPRFAVVLRIFFISSFVSNFVPSVAADLYRAVALARYDVRLAESTASVLMDRLLGVLSMVLVGVAALPLAREAALRQGLAAGLAATAVVCALAAAVVFSDGVARLVQRLAAWLPWARARNASAALTGAVRRYAGHRGALVRVLLLSLAVQALRVVQCWTLARALHVDLSLLTCFALVPIILVIMQLPITVNGFGTTQWAFVTLFGPVGVDAPAAFAISLLFLALGVIGSLPGGLLYATSPPAAIPHRPPA